MNINDAIGAYHDAKNKEIYPPKDIFNNFLAFVAGLGDQGSGSYPPRAQEPPSDINVAFEIYADAKKVKANLSEASYSGLIRCCALNGRKEEGLQLLKEMLAIPLSPRNRTYSALLNAYCHSGDEEMSLNLYSQLSETYRLPLLERDFISLLHLACLQNNSSLFYSTLHSLMEEILVPTSTELWDLLTQWFKKSASRSEKFAVLRSRVVSEEGHLEKCKYVLRSIELSQGNKVKLLKEIEKEILGDPEAQKITATQPPSVPAAAEVTTDTALAPTEDDPVAATPAPAPAPVAHTKRRVNRVMTSHEKWNDFKAWVEDLQTEIAQYSQESSCLGKEKYVLVDGANVGFYQQNYANAPKHVNYQQLQAMIAYLQSIQMIPIVILHCRHISRETVPSSSSDLINFWKGSTDKSNSPNLRFYFTPGGYNDDIFWLFSTVKLDLHVVTNDEMRDHHFQMLSPKWFIRWKDRHQIHFSFGKLSSVYEIESHGNGSGNCSSNGSGSSEVEDASHPAAATGGAGAAGVRNPNKVHLREVTLSFPLKYSHRMQIYSANSDPTSISRGLFNDQYEEGGKAMEEVKQEQDDEQEQEGASVSQEREGYLIPLQDQEDWLCVVPREIVSATGGAEIGGGAAGEGGVASVS
jgi:pentatricopeptide repeat protein